MSGPAIAEQGIPVKEHPAVVPARRPGFPRPRFLRLGPGWLPAAVVALLGAVTLSRFGVPAGDVARYGGWLVLGIALPGTLLWRALRGTPRSFVEDVAAGTALGYAMEIGVYIGLRAAGAPRLILAWPVAVVLAFVAVPELRRHWRPAGAPAAPAAWSWVMAICMILIGFWFTVSFFRTHPFAGAAAAFPYVDLQYHLALAAEVKHHTSPTWPYVMGASLRHHWFPHADMAATSWATGLELRTVMLRMQTFPFLAITAVLTAMLARRVSGRWWPGPVAVVLAFFASVLAPYAWASDTSFLDSRLVSNYAWQSPTQLVAFALFAPVPLLLVDRLRGEPGGLGQWVLIGVLLGATMGSKATYLPLLLAGLAFAAGVWVLWWLARGRRAAAPPWRPVLIGGALALALFLFATFVLYGGGSYGMKLDPLGGFRALTLLRQVGLDGAELPLTVLAAVGAIVLAGALARASGGVGMVTNRERALDPVTLVFAGMVLAGAAVVALFSHPGGSQYYFLHSVLPIAAVLGACGLAALLPAERPLRPVLLGLGAAALCGALAVWAVASWAGSDRPSPAELGGRPAVMTALVTPYLLVAAVLAGLAVAVFALRRRIRWLKGVSLALVLAAATGTGLAGPAGDLADMARLVAEERYRPTPPPNDGRPIPDEALAAGRWLRAHSDVDDLVATNAHCRAIIGGQCDNRHFWIAAYTERRVLVEGWGYTDYVINAGKDAGVNYRFLPFQDPQRLAANDLAFSWPSSLTLGALQHDYDVRWLFVDERYEQPAPNLGEFARERYRSPHFTIYELA